MEQWKKRLKHARELRGFSKTAFAKAVPVSNATVTDWEKPTSDGGIGEISGPKLMRVCSVLGITPEWLLHGKGSGPDLEPQSATDHQAPEIMGTYQVSPERFRQIPVIGKGMGGLPDTRNWTDSDFAVGASNEFAEVATTDPNAFIARVEESSMAPRYNPGEYFLVEPNTMPEVGDDVLVRFVNDGTSLKRLLSMRDGYISLGSYNTTATITAKEEEVAWVYYVAHPVPVRKIKTRI
jgi:phage repressor protein C with HTH and peptisase S24 domain